MSFPPILLILAVVSGDPASLEPGTSQRCEQPTRLWCELLSHPERTVIYDPQPEFGWQCGPYEQSAYHIRLRQKSAKSGEQTVIWDTGKVDSRESLNVEYDGPPLLPGGRYQWQVKVWNESDTESEWSEPQYFRMALMPSVATTSRYDVVEVPQTAQTVRAVDGQAYFADFGTAAFGYLKLRIPDAKEQRTLRVHFGEKLAGERIDRKPGGSIRYYSVEVSVPIGATEVTVHPPRNRRNTSGQAVALPRQVGVVAPFRYVEIEGTRAPIRREDVIQVRIEYPFDEDAASFESSDATLNAIWELCIYSIRATTFCGVYVDGDRERIPYEADAYINQLSHYGVDQEYALARYSHEYLLNHPTWPTEWKQHSVLMAWADYWYTGDDESLARNYSVLKNEKVLTALERPDGLVDTTGYRDIVDWPEAERDGFEMLPVNTVVNAFHYATLKRMAYLASVVNRDVDQQEFLQKAALLRKTFNRVLWNEDQQNYVDGEGSSHSSLHANLFPLAFGLVPEDRQAGVIAFLKSRQMRCSVYAAQYLLEGLYRAGEDQYAWQLLTSRDERSWYNMIRSGSTITLEAWDQKFKPNLDWNHAWGAAPANLIPAYLVGVRPLEPGFERIVIQPRPGSLDYFTAKVPSPRGGIQIEYSVKEQGNKLTVEIPGNCSAKVGVPLRGEDQLARLSWNGRAVSSRIAGRHAWLDEVPPGKHVFQTMFASPVAQVSAAE